MNILTQLPISIIHGDCRELPEALIQTFDHMLTDPPYSASVHTRASTMKGGVAGKNNIGFQPLSPELRMWLASAASKVKGWSLLYTDLESIGTWAAAVEEGGAEYIRAMTWTRWAMPQFTGDRPAQGAEAIVLACNAAFSGLWNGPGAFTHFETHELTETCMRGEGKHKTQKPLDQALELVSWFTNPGETVFDPCAGRGTFAQACRLLGRQCVAVELDAEEAGEAHKAATRVMSPIDDSDQARVKKWLEREPWELSKHDSPNANRRRASREADKEHVRKTVRV